MCGLTYTVSNNDYNNIGPCSYPCPLCKVVLCNLFLKTTTTVNQVLPDQLCIQIFTSRLYFEMTKVVQQIIGAMHKWKCQNSTENTLTIH